MIKPRDGRIAALALFVAATERCCRAIVAQRFVDQPDNRISLTRPSAELGLRL
jgi:hypothetical protein